jgi:hypothetical protein
VNRVRILSLVFILSVPLLLAAPVGGPPEEITLRGYVVDAMCGRAMAGKGKAATQAASHTRACALDKECSASGYGLMVEGVWHEFDDAGDATAKAMVTASRRTRGLLFEVKGTAGEGGFRVASMKEVDDGAGAPPAKGGGATPKGKG